MSTFDKRDRARAALDVDYRDTPWSVIVDRVVAAMDAATANEREQCAKLAERVSGGFVTCHCTGTVHQHDIGDLIAQGIRQRGG